MRFLATVPRGHSSLGVPVLAYPGVGSEARAQSQKACAVVHNIILLQREKTNRSPSTQGKRKNKNRSICMLTLIGLNAVVLVIMAEAQSKTDQELKVVENRISRLFGKRLS